MIEEIEVADLGVIAQANLALHPGLTVITGETGAGKTMLLTALNLLLGGKADLALIRAGAERSSVEGTFRGVPTAVAERAREAGAELDEDTLIVARTLTDGGRSRAHLGGRSVPAGVLAEIGQELITVHGQADQMRLRSATRQRDLVDAFAPAGHGDLLARVAETAHEVRRTREALESLEAGARTRRIELESLRTALAEIDEVDPQPAEDDQLREEADRLDNVEDLREAVFSARSNLQGPDAEAPGAAGNLEEAARWLARVSSHDSALASLAERATQAARVVADLDAELGVFATDLDADPDRLDAIHARRAVLNTLARSYGMPFAERTPDDPPAGSVDAVLAWAAAARERLDDLTGPGADPQALADRLQELTQDLTGLCAEVTANRRAAGERLAQAVTTELRELAMPNAGVEVAVEPTQPSATGADDVAILLAPHPGATARPLGQGASGGELSRVMLALEVALAQQRGAAGPGTFVFDEVDAGIGGRTAGSIGARLATLARRSQVVVVTHLAQVAVYGDRHLVVHKRQSATDTVTEVSEVSGEDRVAEIARMLSGESTATALEHAATLLAGARGTIGAQ